MKSRATFGVLSLLTCVSACSDGGTPGGGSTSASSGGGQGQATISASIDGELVGANADGSKLVTTRARTTLATWQDDSQQSWREFTGSFSLGAYWGNVYSGGTKVIVVDPYTPLLNEVDTQTGMTTSLLTPDENKDYSRFNPFTEARSSEDGSVAVALAGPALVKRRGQPLQTFKLAEKVEGVGGYHLLQITPDGSKAFLAFFNSPFVNLKFLWTMDVQTGVLTPVDLSDSMGTRVVAADKVKAVVMNQDFTQLIIHEMPTTVTHYDRATKRATKLFQGAAEHVATLTGQPNTTATDMTGFSFQGRYVSAVINVYSTADYWGGRKNAYVADTTTGETFTIGFAPADAEALAKAANTQSAGAGGTYFPRAFEPLSGDGWQYRTSVMSPNGDYAAFSVLWSGGVSKALVGPFTVVVPKAQWRPIR